MISAMPAVALRREREKYKASNDKRTNKTIYSINFQDSTLYEEARRYNQLDCEERRKKYIFYIGTVCLTTGSISFLMGIGFNKHPLRIIGIIFIIIGVILYFVKLSILFGKTKINSFNLSNDNNNNNNNKSQTPESSNLS